MFSKLKRKPSLALALRDSACPQISRNSGMITKAWFATRVHFPSLTTHLTLSACGRSFGSWFWKLPSVADGLSCLWAAQGRSSWLKHMVDKAPHYMTAREQRGRQEGARVSRTMLWSIPRGLTSFWESLLPKSLSPSSISGRQFL